MSNRSLNIGPPVSVGTLDHNSRYAATLEAAMMELAPSHRSTGTKCAATIKGKGSLVLWFRENLATKPHPVFRSVKEVAREETEVIEADRAILKATPNTTLTTQERAHLLGAAFQQAAREYNAPADNYDVRFSLSETLMLSPRDMNLDEKAMQLTKKSLMNVAWPGNVIIATATQVDWIVPRINKGRALKEITNTGSAHNRGSDAVCGPHPLSPRLQKLAHALLRQQQQHQQQFPAALASALALFLKMMRSTSLALASILTAKARAALALRPAQLQQQQFPAALMMRSTFLVPASIPATKTRKAKVSLNWE